ncbi:HAD family hydrolase [Meridianimarinicoccus roseus]|uniref:HAD family hydrolase n=1 Tax=Meridianimarinicoccus roseus TaxID=2072018 RepID=UPI001EE6491D|nr:HAD family phosphatase [Meridianimarinicoccus roseus]
MTSPDQPTAALLFDLDGTLINSDVLHFEVFRDLFAERGREIDEAFYLQNVHGQLNADIFAVHLPGEDAAALSDDKEARFRDRLDADVPPMPGTVALLETARSRGWGLAVVTNAPRVNAATMLAAIGLTDAFDTIVIGEECTRAKPHPDPYLAAMEALKVPPAACLAFEDSPSGLRAARASGAYTVGIRSSLQDAPLRAAGAQATLADFTDPDLTPLLDRLKG